MTRRSTLPIPLQHSAFAFATGRAAGVSEHRLRAADLSRPFWGTRAHTDGPLALHDLCRTLLQRLPAGSVISHSTSALLHGIPVPSRLEKEPYLHVSVASPARAQHARGIRGHSMVMGTDDVISINDVPMTTASRTWCDLATLTTSTDELIMAGDRLLYWKEPLADRAGLSAAIVGHGHRRGARLLSAAFPELVDRSESPRKTLIRLAIIADGLPRPHLNFDLRDASGRLIARGDLAYPEYRMLLDYEGEQHRLDRSQWNRDLTRFNDIQDVDWYSMRIGSEHPLPEVVARIRAALLRRGWRP